MSKSTLTRAGTESSSEREVPISQLAIPDCGHIAEGLRAEGKVGQADAVMETYNLARDVLRRLQAEWREKFGE